MSLAVLMNAVMILACFAPLASGTRQAQLRNQEHTGVHSNWVTHGQSTDTSSDADSWETQSDSATDLNDAPQPAPPGLAASPAAAAAASPAAYSAASPMAAEEEQKLDEQMLEAEMDVMNTSDPNVALKEELAALMWLESELRTKYAGMDEESYKVKIAAMEISVANETTPGMAKMLGDMRRDMHRFAAPFYRRVLLEQINDVVRKQKNVLAKIEKAKAAAQAASIEDDEPKPSKDEPENAGASSLTSSFLVLLCAASVSAAF